MGHQSRTRILHGLHSEDDYAQIKRNAHTGVGDTVEENFLTMTSPKKDPAEFLSSFEAAFREKCNSPTLPCSSSPYSSPTSSQSECPNVTSQQPENLQTRLSPIKKKSLSPLTRERIIAAAYGRDITSLTRSTIMRPKTGDGYGEYKASNSDSITNMSSEKEDDAGLSPNEEEYAIDYRDIKPIGSPHEIRGESIDSSSCYQSSACVESPRNNTISAFTKEDERLFEREIGEWDYSVKLMNESSSLNNGEKRNFEKEMMESDYGLKTMPISGRNHALPRRKPSFERSTESPYRISASTLIRKEEEDEASFGEDYSEDKDFHEKYIHTSEIQSYYPRHTSGGKEALKFNFSRIIASKSERKNVTEEHNKEYVKRLEKSALTYAKSRDDHESVSGEDNSKCSPCNLILKNSGHIAINGKFKNINNLGSSTSLKLLSDNNSFSFGSRTGSSSEENLALTLADNETPQKHVKEDNFMNSTGTKKILNETKVKSFLRGRSINQAKCEEANPLIAERKAELSSSMATFPSSTSGSMDKIYTHGFSKLFRKENTLGRLNDERRSSERASSEEGSVAAGSLGRDGGGTPAAASASMFLPELHSDRIRSKLGMVEKRFLGFDSAIADDHRKKVMADEIKFQDTHEKILRIEKTLHAEILRRVEASKSVEYSIDEMCGSLANKLEKKILKQFEKTTSCLSALVTKCENLEKQISQLKEEIPVRLQADAVVLIRDIRELHHSFQLEEKKALEKDNSLFRKMAEFEFSIGSRIEEESANREEQFLEFHKVMESYLGEEDAKEEKFKDFILFEIGALQDALRAASQAREQSDEQIIQAINQYTEALQRGVIRGS